MVKRGEDTGTQKEDNEAEPRLCSKFFYFSCTICT
jgi:hypothetical protein